MFQISGLRRDWNAQEYWARRAYVRGSPFGTIGRVRPRNADSVADRLFVVERQAAGGLVLLDGVAGDAASLQDRLDVAVELDVLDALGELEAGAVGVVPLLAGAVVRLRGEQGSCRGQVPELVVGLGGGGFLEGGRLLAVGVAAAAVGADLAGPNLVPGLGHVQHHAVVVERLEGPGDVGGNFGQEAGVGVAVRIEGLLAVLGELADRELAQDADTFFGVAAQGEVVPLFRQHLADRLQDQNADAPDVAVLVEAGVGALLAPVAAGGG